MRYKEETCFIPKKRPLREMEDRITKIEEINGVECSSWSGNVLRDETEPENIEYIGHITPKQYQNIKHLAFGDSVARNTPHTWRSGYTFSDKEERLAEEVKKKCNAPTVCAFSIRGERSEDEVVTGFNLGEKTKSEHPYVLQYYIGSRNRSFRDGRNVSRTFPSINDLKEHLKRVIGEGSTEIGYTRVYKEEFEVPVQLERATLEKDKVQYLSH